MTTLVSEKTNIDPSAQIGPGCIIEDNVTVGANCTLAANVILRSGTTLADNVSVDSFAVIGGLPQSLDFDSTIPSYVHVDSGTTIREYVTINRPITPEATTKVGKNCFLMANSHVAHDCVLGNHVIFANSVLPAGHVTIGDYCVFGGNVIIHQRLNIGEGVMIAGRAGLNLDIPPFLMVSEHCRVHGLNLVGLKRRKIPSNDIAELKGLLNAVLNTPGSPYKNAQASSAQTQTGQCFLDFFKSKGPKGCVQQKHIQFNRP